MFIVTQIRYMTNYFFCYSNLFLLSNLLESICSVLFSEILHCFCFDETVPVLECSSAACSAELSSAVFL